jgi:gliding motility-associated-like protein
MFNMLQSIALLAALLLFQPLLAQKEGNIWYFGQSGRGFDFNATPPAVLGNGAMRIHHGEPFTMSDPCGNLLFYSDGQTVWNRDHQIMLNGDGLLRIASTQPVVAVPHPGQDSLYYLFVQAETNSVLPPKAELRYSIIDLRLDKGLGGIAVKNQFLYQTNGSLLTSVRHGNGQDYWIITGEVDANRFLAYRVDQNGLDATPVVNVMPFTFTYSRKLRASPDGHYIAVNAYSGSPEREAWLIGFDNATGKATGTHLLPVKGSGTPVEFSPDGRRMYFSVPGNQMAQLTLDYAGEQTVSSEPVIIKQSQGRNFSDFRLGSDGKLYLGSSYVVDVIDNPNDEAAQLQYRQNAYRVDAFYLPNNLAGYVLGKQTDFPVDPVCGNSPIQFLPRVNYKVRQWQWDFGDPASGEANASTVREPSHRFSGPGSYPVQLITTDYCGDKDTVRKNVILYPDPVIDLPEERVEKCFSEVPVTFSVRDYPFTRYRWNTGATTAGIQARHSGWYRVEASTPCETHRDSVYLDVTPPATAYLPDDTIVCDGNFARLDALNEGATYRWSTGETTRTIQVDKPGKYWVKITNRCSSTADTANLVFIRQDVSAFIPNVFTPNGDGYNDRFELSVLNTPAYSLSIVNRWGKQVYYSRNPFGYWDGRVNGGEEAAPGMYFWRVTATDCRNQPITYKGFVSILR